MEVRADALCRNLDAVRASVGPDVRIVPMVKADAYGIGLAGAVEALATRHPWGFGVAAVEEGIAIRELGFMGPILVLSPTPPGLVADGVAAELTLSVSSVEILDLMVAAARGRAASFHLEVDTGMGRAGFDWRDAERWVPDATAAHAAGVRWTGCFTHLHSADEGRPSVDEQVSRFRAVLASFPRPEGEFLVHALNSAGSLRCPEYAGDLVRPGIFLYGGGVGGGLPAPEPVAAVRARIVHVRSAPAGTTVGYGSTYVSRGDERWATAAIGYGDGLPRVLGNRGHALVQGERVPIVGRISMDVTVLEISHAGNVAPGDVATFIGSDGPASISLDEVAVQAGTISYEILTGFTPRLRRVWVGGEGGSDGS